MAGGAAKGALATAMAGEVAALFASNRAEYDRLLALATTVRASADYNYHDHGRAMQGFLRLAPSMAKQARAVQDAKTRLAGGDLF